MRFLIGLVLGTAIAIGMSASTDTRERLLTIATGFFKQIHLPEQGPAVLVAQPDQSDHQQVVGHAQDRQPEHAAAPATETVSDASIVEPLDQLLTVTSKTPQPDSALPLATDTTPVEELTSVAGASDNRSSLLPLSLVQAAWSPFYSEASASGFAARLERHLQRPFRVVKNGPANYQVVFHYRSEIDRKKVLESIHLLTGYKPQSPNGNS